MDFPVSDGLETTGLDGQTTLGATAPTVEPNMMKWANDLLDREEEIVEDHSPSGGEELRPNMKPGRLRIVRARPFLAVIYGGRD